MRLRIALFAVALLLSGCTGLWVRDWPSNAVSADTPRPAHPDLRETFTSLPGSPIEQASLRLLDDNAAAWAARWRLLAQARSTIDTSYFILGQDVFGMAFLGHLLHKAREGVNIRILLDAQGRLMSKSEPEVDCLPALARDTNISLKLYRPMSQRVMLGLLALNPAVAAPSNHDKIVVVDRRKGLIGGRNIEAHYFGHPAELSDAFHDFDVVIESSDVATALTDAFEVHYESNQAKPIRAPRDGELARCARDMRAAYEAVDEWMRAGQAGSDQRGRAANPWREDIAHFVRLRGILDRPADPPLRAESRIINSLPRPGSSADPISHSLFRLLESSSRGVFIENPYVALTKEAVSFLAEAGGDGVGTTIVTNGPLSTDNPLSWQIFREKWPELLARVPRLRIFVNGTRHNVHGKLAVFDRQAVLVGSYNLDPISMTMNGEIALVVWSKEFAQRIMQRPRQWLAQGPPELYEYQIQRDADGRPLRDADGNVLVLFGPEDHSNPKEWPSASCGWRLLGASAHLPMIPPIF